MLAKRQQTHDSRATEILKGFNLGEETAADPGIIGEMRSEHFDCHVLVRLFVLCLIDSPHAATTKLSENSIGT